MPPADAPGTAAEDRAHYRFGDVVVDTHARTVTRDGGMLMLEPKAYEVLLCLLRHPGELVTHEDLLDHVWGHRHVTPGVLTRAIAQLRHALGDDAHAPRYIRTRHSLGYCFIGTLVDDPDDPDDPDDLDDLDDAGAPAGADRGSGTHVASRGEPAEATPMLAGAPGAVDPAGTQGVATTVADPRATVLSHAVPSGLAGTDPDTGPRAAQDGASDEAAPSAAERHAREDATDPDGPAAAAPAWKAAGNGLIGHDARSARRMLGRKAGIAAALIVVLVLALALAAVVLERPSPTPPVQPSIAVLPFTSADASRDGRYFAEGLALEMQDALARVPGLDVVAVPMPRGGTPPDAAAVGRRLRVANVLEANVRRDGDRVRIDARLTEPSTGLTRWTGQFDRADADVFAMQAEIAQQVVRALIGALPDRGVVERLAPTHNVNAYNVYLLGLQQLHANDGEAGLQRAIGHFHAALASDPRFARAQAGICRAELERFEDGLSAAAFERADAACRRAAAMAPQLREVDLALGQLHRAGGHHARAVHHFTRALDDVALRPAAHVGLGRTYDALDRRAEADAHFAQALRLSPSDASIHRELGYRAYLAGDLEGAIGAYRTATSLAPEDERLWSSLGGLYLASDDRARAAEAFERSLSVRSNYAALSNYGSLRYEAGAYAEAGGLYRQAAALEPSDFRVWGNLGDALSASGDPAAALAAYRRGEALAERYTAIRPDDAQALALLAWYRANLGDAAAARALLSRAEALGSEPGEVAFLAAQAKALLGQPAAARVQLERAAQAGVSDSRLAASPVLAPLLQGERATRD